MIIIKMGNISSPSCTPSGSRATDGKPRHKRLLQRKHLEQLITNEVINRDTRGLIVFGQELREEDGQKSGQPRHNGDAAAHPETDATSGAA